MAHKKAVGSFGTTEDCKLVGNKLVDRKFLDCKLVNRKLEDCELVGYEKSMAEQE